ncbi:uncharacterized protein LOC120334159 [Styela clava]
MRIPSGALSANGSDSPESKAAFFVVESGSCRVPAVSKLPDIPTNKEKDDDYMPEVYSYPLNEDYTKEQYHTNGKIVNMRVDIKMKVLPGTGTMAPPSTPAHTTTRRRSTLGGAIAPPTTPTNSSTEVLASQSWRQDDVDYQDNDVVDAYGPYERAVKSMILRNRSAPPVMSQYRTRLTTTSQWIKKKAVAESSNLRSESKVGRPSTSVRPFSERESPDSNNPHLSRVCIQPPLHPSRIPMPDFGSFRGKPPISPAMKCKVKQRSRHATNQSWKKRDSDVNETTNNNSSTSLSQNKVDQYVSELRKSIKTRRSTGENGHKKTTPFALWAISNSCETSSVSAELETFELNSNREVSSLITRNTTNSKGNEAHTVRREIIKQIADNSDEKENVQRKKFLEVKGDTPPSIVASEQTCLTENPIETAHVVYPTEPDKQTPVNIHKGFPRGKTTLYTTAQRGTLRYTRQLMSRNDSHSQSKFSDLDKVDSTKVRRLPNYGGINDHSLPYLKLHHSLVEYRSYKQGGAPFVKTLI